MLIKNVCLSFDPQPVASLGFAEHVGFEKTGREVVKKNTGRVFGDVFDLLNWRTWALPAMKSKTGQGLVYWGGAS